MSTPWRHPEEGIICVVDDDLSNLKALVRLLRAAGLPILPFENPRLFLEYAKAYPVSLAIVDLRMPEVSGLDVQRALYDFCPKAKVIMMTGEQEPSLDRTIALDQGAIAFLFKPLSLSALLEAIRIVYPVPSQ
jgi:FixJ family two-component response regulator